MLQKPMALSLRLAFFACLFINLFVEEVLSIRDSEKFVYEGVGIKVFGVVARQKRERGFGGL